MTQFHSLSAAAHRARTPRTVARATEHFLEGPHPWGSVDVSPTGRTTWNRTRLTVFPPGTNRGERRALQFYRTWPVAGAVIGLLTFLALDSWPPMAATAMVLGVYVAGFVVALRLTTTLRPGLRRLTVMSIPVGGRFETVGDVEYFDHATDRLRTLDTLRERGLLSPLEYEAGWAEIYDAIPEQTLYRRTLRSRTNPAG
ncbi:DUF6611 family protein [Subtercola boreus]|uniref:Uncharacterized protein n=1 Tax=Subtercola boreus TaxID=120213 RepID=A0A3E0WAT7_9MICO|nr:DUF6611 family protein [Subtercola boreus]RFA21144.1 hypothetical protein B7R24_07065 [Subtercola boreus]RFA21527.1 hypothetical protein B7R23_07010 [Subtercola boreus]RFA27497.1 hypothetical protein B7R25_07135 [Subtercola boreus]